jgi:hypothetical protein
MSFHPELIVRFETEDAQADEQAFEDFFGSAFDIGVYVVAPDLKSAHECKFFIRPRPEGAYQDESFLAMASARLERWMESREKPARVECLDSDGAVCKTLRKQ